MAAMNNQSAIILAWVCLAVGVIGLGLGVAGDRNLTIPGAILVGAAVVALQKR
jgi:hypothetical protein